MSYEETAQAPIDSLIAESRAAREALNVLVRRLREERMQWEREAVALTRRERLTAPQRDRLEQPLKERGTRRG